jgi:hypothetical protein
MNSSQTALVRLFKIEQTHWQMKLKIRLAKLNLQLLHKTMPILLQV